MKNHPLKKHDFVKAVITLAFLSVIILAVSAYFVYDHTWIGPAFLGLTVLSVIVLKAFGIELKSVYPDIFFGIIDNGILVFAAIIGGNMAGIQGAVIGGAAGNTITDAIGGLIEGKISQKLRRNNIQEKRQPMSTMLGKLIGCLFGAALGFMVIWAFEFLF